jgi:hypothetical protein
LQQWVISQDNLQKGHKLLCEFVQEFEQLYYQCRAKRIHFVRQSIHLLTHLASETIRLGPLSCYSQWPIETAISNLGKEIRLHSDPYANIAQRRVLRTQLNLIVAMFLGLDLSEDNSLRLPHGAKDLRKGYVLLHSCENIAKPVVDAKANAILEYWELRGWPNLDAWP